ncbi:beta-propeller domain-containing protein [Colwellia sp. E2M01]|uniref:beta-propeller domain-containing protein n=1 Tax=Colwellia sp. E2M01 TaxID=2841561 RepID=UPI00339D8A46
MEGTLGWRSAQFRIKELTDGTVVAITSQPDSNNNNAQDIAWCCNFNSDWIHKLQLFQKDESNEYQKIAELPNENSPDNDDTPQSLGKAGEDIYGVRIDENSVKVVTFQQTDPLYVFDITDRDNPIFSGELADSGFSAYLHTFDDLILGVGYDANEWGNRLGMKVELYKSDATTADGIVSLDEYSFGTYANTPVEYDHHAFTSLDISDNKIRIAIPASVSNNSEENDYSGLLLFSLDKDNEALSFDGKVINTIDYHWSSWSDRAVIQHSEQGSVVHYIHLGKVISELWPDNE